MELNPNETPAQVIKEGELILETFIQVLTKNGTEIHGKNSVN